MEETAEALYLMGNLIGVQHRAHRACCARAPDHKNMQLRYLGTSLVVMGTIIAAVAYHTFINPNPTYMHVILSVVQGFMFISGITAMAIGWLLFVGDNPRNHHRLAKEAAEALYLMGNLMRSQYRAHRAIIRAGRARAPDQENTQLRYLGTSLVVMGTINAAVAYHAFINPNPSYVHVILSVVQGFMFISGITAMAIGWLLFVEDNPRKHHRLAKVIMLLIQFASAFTFGIILLACSSSVALH